jgi:hypothetical protein
MFKPRLDLCCITKGNRSSAPFHQDVPVAAAASSVPMKLLDRHCPLRDEALERL